MENSEKLFEYLKRAAADLQETRQRLRELEAGEREPVAIVGMGCRFPGEARTPEELWDLVAAGVDTISDFPADRGWDVGGQDGGEPGASYRRQGGFVYDAGDFDPGFFRISPREALAMDPQQRMLLEVSWEALERAGIDPASLRGSLTGVFTGVAYMGYSANQSADGDGFGVTGNATSVVSGRVSYVLGLEGPAVSVDTACSSALVALHLACQALRAGECTLALAGGVTVMATPMGFNEFALQRGLAADGRCKAFAAAADGTGWGEGAGVLVVERLSDARRHGHRVLAVVSGSAVNQDGASNGLTAPNGPSQQRVIKAALASARLSPDDVDAVEAHGTGTALGDPIEAQALLATYGQGRDPDRPLWLGSLKSNIGHTQQAAGAAGVIKMVLALQHDMLPPTLHVDEPSPHVDWSAGTVRLLTEPVPWPATDHPRRAGISAFGISGTNAHLIVEEPPAHDGMNDPAEVASPPGSTGLVPWVVSGRTAEALRAQAGRLGQWVTARPGLDPADVGWSLAAGRSIFAERAVVLAADTAGLAAGLDAVAAGLPGAGVIAGQVPEGGPGKVAFVFAGQGSQRTGMGRVLAAAYPVFADAVREVCGYLDPLLGRPVGEVVFAGPGSAAAGLVDQTVFTQAGLFAVQIGLARLLGSWGITPDYVTGHSVGEIAAAHVAGVFSLADACALVAARGRLMQELGGGGAMAAVAAPAAEVAAMLDLAGGQVGIAAVNGPGSVVVSGAAAGVGAVGRFWRGRGVRVRRLRTSHAFHSPLVEPMLAGLAEVAAGLSFAAPRVPVVCALTGEPDAGLVASPGYWARQAREAVRFADCVRWLAGAGTGVFAELGPDGALSALGPAVLAAGGGDGAVWVPVLRARRPEAVAVLSAAAETFVRGISVDWTAVFAGRGARRVDLPTYAFRHQRYWPGARPQIMSNPAAGGDGAEAGFWAAVDRQDLAGLAGELRVTGDEPLSAVLPMLAAWRRRRQRQSTVDRWRYRVTWQPVTGLGDGAALGGRWLLVVPAGSVAGRGLAAACGEVLAGGDAQVVTLEAGPADLDREVLAGRLRAAADQELAGVAGVSGVVSLLALAEGAGAGAAGTLVLVQALGDAGIRARLWVLTRGAVTAGETGPVSAAQAMAWGLGRVVALEHPQRWGGLVDVPEALTGRVAGWLREILAGATEEDQIAVRPGGVLARRLIRAPAVAAARRWRPSGSVLVTGGTGALGGRVARWVAGRGAPRVILASRRGISAAGAARLAATVCGAGAAVMVAACDAGDRADLAGLWARLAGAGVTVSAVMHAAGAPQSTALADVSLAEFAAVSRAKTEGAMLLDELTGSEAGEFVLFSSVSATWGSSGQAAYAAANAALDALAEDRRARGLAATSVAWGPWEGGGMGEGEVGQQLRRWGLRPMSPRLAVAALGQAVDRGETCVAVADMDWRQFVPSFTMARPSPLLTGLAEVRQIMAADQVQPRQEPGRGLLAERLAGLPAGEQEQLVLDLVCREAASVLGHASAQAVRPGAVFRDLGFDSLTAVELRDKLSVVTGLRLPATLVFDYPTPLVLAEWLRAQIAGTPAAGAAPVAPVPAAVTGDPVAVVAMGCRFPGGVAGPEDLWELVRSGRDAVSGFPADRGWESGVGGDRYARLGGFVYEATEFDAGFFGISPREALAMDPQQRLLLEVCWEAIERAGIDAHSLRGSRTGVFAGISSQDYPTVLALAGEGSDGHVVTGNAASVVSGRVSYVLGLEGPAVSVDTACSSALVALHLACQALRAGECDLALAGGVTVMATPGAFGEFATQGGLAADGRCKAFGAGADGTGWGEGAGVLLVERLTDARRLGHPVLAVVSGSAVNQDGASNGLTAPNGPSQQRVIRAALASAGLSPDQVDVVEGHGTGTVLGDPIEAQALLATYGQDRDPGRPLWLGSVKSNIGHTQQAAGAAGAIKMVMALGAGVLPPTLHAGEPSPHVDWSAGTVRLLTEPVPWPAADRPWRAGVSAFGMSGTNAHVIVEQAPAVELAAAETVISGLASGVVPWVVSGRGAGALRGQAGRLAGFARSGCGGGTVADVGWSLAAGRSVFAERAVVLASAGPGFAAGLEAVAAGEPGDGVVAGGVPDGGAGKVVFVFPGQGGQWAGMAAGLAGCCPAFAARLGECAAALQPHVGWPVAETLRDADPGALERVEVVQPVLWAVMVALAAAWESVGVTPDAVAGHSQGEIAAATVAGILTVEDAARVVAVRSRALAGLPGGGAMVAVAWPEAVAESAVAGCGGRVWVAAVNGPGAVVLAGDREVLAGVVAVAEAEGVRVRWLPVSYASHGPDVDAVAGVLARDLAGLTPAAGRIPLWSAVTGQVADGAGLDGAYWVANLRERVRFEEVIRGLAGSGHGVFVEVSPHPVLVTAVEQTLADAGRDEGVVAGTLRRDDGGPGRLLASAAEVFVRGVNVDWAAVFAGSGARRVLVPTYAFQRERYWPAPRPVVGGDVHGAGLAAAGHPLLGAAVELAGDEGGVLFTGLWSVAAFPWLGDHAVFGAVLVPGTAVLEVAAWAGAVVGCPLVAELALEVPLVLPADGGVRVQVRVGGSQPDGGRAVGVYSRADAGADGDEGAGWVRHASGVVVPGGPEAGAGEAGLGGVWPPAGAVGVPVGGWYERLAEQGYGYGPAFRGLAAVWRRGDEVFAEARLPEEQHAAGFAVHPALLDAALHAAGFLSEGWGPDEGGRGLVPFSWAGVRVAGRDVRALRVRLRPAGNGAVAVLAADPDGDLVVAAERLVLRPVSAGQLQAAGGGKRDALFGVEWVPVAGTAAGGGRLVVLGGDSAAITGLAAAGIAVSGYADLAGLAAAGAGGGEAVPPVVVAWLPGLVGASAEPGRAGRVREVAGVVLGLVQGWLGGVVAGGSVLVVVTSGAVAGVPGEGVGDVAGAGVWGLVRSAQSECPGQLVLADVDGLQASWQALAGAVGWGEPELVVRQGRVLGRRLVRAAVPAGEAGGAWRLDAAGDGTLGGVRRVPVPEAAGPLGPGQVRVAVRAAGLNFRDALITLGVYPGAAVIGGEGAGVVTGTGPGVSSVAAGDRVLGIWAGGLGPVVVADEQMVAKIPAGWSFAQAASVPVVFVTAYYALVDLAGLRAGESVLVHAAAGGVGMAAVQLARYLGAEVFATASPAKQATVAELGVDPARIASSRTAGFAGRFREVTGGRGVDVVLDSLAGELVDASLGLVAPGGRFVEMGKADIRDAGAVAARWPGVSYRAFDLWEAGPGRIGEILAVVLGLFGRGVLSELPVRSWELDRAGEALRFMGQGRHTGKNVVRVPAVLDGSGTVLVTGGSGVLAGLTARHLAGSGRAGRLVLASRRGPAAPGTARLAADLAGAGVQVRVCACDAADREALAGLLGQVPASHPLAGVFHTAGALDDGVISALTPGRLDRVLAPKADAALILDELTAGAELSAFVLFSSASATFGAPGQGNYAAANAVLDALAQDRRARGLPAVSIAWGMWEQETGLTAHLGQDGRSRSRGGILPLTTPQGLDLLDAALAAGPPAAVAVNLDLAALRAQAGMLPPLWHGLVRAPAPAGAAAAPADETFRRQLAGLPQAGQQQMVLDLVRGQAAAVLGHSSPDPVRPGAAFRDLGFDSLTAIELRNRLSTITGLRFPATLVFDHPTPRTLAIWLHAEILGDQGTAVVSPPPAATSPVTGDPVAVVAMSCRFPGGVASQEDLWELVTSGTDAISGLPADRGWDIAGVYDPDPDQPGTTYSRHGGFMHGVGEFDAGFFGISPREALAMDPQQRLLLEVCWEAIERAGIDPRTLRGSRTGVFAGTSSQDYETLLAFDTVGNQGQAGVGNAASVISGRVSYVLGLEGPAVSVDTACSSSLVALHLASQALRAGECDLALAGGVMVMATPGTFIVFSKQRGLAADGRCKAFGAGADGFGAAEGAGVLVVERLSDARRNGHPVLAVIAGSAVNQDGASNGLTAPNGPSQQRVIRAALASAGLSPGDVDVVEGHGTGTRLGDPIEAQALIAAYGQGRDPGQPLWLGSVKSNIGHAQAAAGMAGVIKMVMALRHRVLPATLHAEEPSPHVDWSAGTVRLLAEPVPWPAGERPRRAGVSSFGISGTNAHVIVEQAPPGGPGGNGGAGSPPVRGGVWGGRPPGETLPWVVSGRGDAGLRGQAGRLAGFARAGAGGTGVTDVGWSLAARRAMFEDRAVVLAADLAGFATALEAVAAGEPAAGVITGRAADGGPGKIVFVFPGQGGQWPGMAGLASSCPAFAERLAECTFALQPHVDWPVARTLAEPGGEALERADVVQPLLWAVMVALAAAWESVGVTPDAVAGHSQGEIAAVTVAGILSLPDAARMIAVRSKAVGRLMAGGAMAAVAWPSEVAGEAVARSGGQVWVAAVNSPASVVLAGDRNALAEIVARAEAGGVRVRWLPVDYASHGPAVDQVAGQLARELAGITPTTGRVPFWSSVTGELADGTELNGEYWAANLRQQVRFADVIHGLAEAGHGAFIEVSPHPVLTSAIEHTLEEAGLDDGLATGTLRRGDGGLDRLLASAAEVFVRGVPVDWAGMFSGSGARLADLPTYAFQRRRYWPSIRPGGGDMARTGLAAAGHPLLVAAVGLAGEDGALFTGQLSVPLFPWLADHAVFGTVLVPGTALAEMAAWAGGVVGCPRVDELTLEAPLVLPDEGAVTIQLRVGSPRQDGGREVSLYSRVGGQDEWTRHAGGILAPDETRQAGPAQETGPPGQWPPAGAVPVPLEGFYARTAERGYGYGPAFQGLAAVWRRGDEVFAEVRLPEEQHADAARFGVHPALLDAALQAVGFIAAEGWSPGPAGDDGEGRRGLVPFAWEGLRITGQGARVLRVRLCPADQGAVEVRAADESGQHVVAADRLVLRPISAGQLRAERAGRRNSMLTVDWVPVTGTGTAGGRWVVLGADQSAITGLTAAGLAVTGYADLAALAQATASGQPVPPVVVAWLPGLAPAVATTPTGPAGDGNPAGDAAEAVRGAVHAALGLVQRWLDRAEFAGSVLVVATERAVAAEAAELVTDLAGAAAWGLVRSAQSENPGQLALADLDGLQASWQALAGAVGRDEPELVIRRGRVLGRRLTRVANEPVQPGPAGHAATAAGLWRPDGSGTVLITGASGVLAGLVARHLAVGRRAGHLVLASRRGAAAVGTAQLAAALAGNGMHVQVTACDAADRQALAGLLGQIPAAHPLTALIHTAGVLDDGVVGALTPDRVDHVLRPKVDAAIALDELTAKLNLSAFVLFSSAAATFGSPGQGNYAAANAFLDALAARRRARGLPAVSIAWGLWEQTTGMTSHLGDVGRSRVRSVMLPLTTEQGLDLFDAALSLNVAVAVAIGLDPAGLRVLAGAGTLAPLWHGMVRVPASRQAGVPGPDTLRQQLMRRLAGAPHADHDRIVLDLVRTQAASVLGHPSADEVGSKRGFLELGFDSLTAVELRNRLNAATGLRLPATTVFDFPTPAVLAQHVRSELIAAGQMGADAGGERVDQAQRTAAGQLSTEIDSQHQDQATRVAAPQPEAAIGGLSDLYDRTMRDGTSDDFLKLMQDVADFRPSFDETNAADVVQPARIARGAMRPSLICFPSFVGKSDVYQYARFAAGFRGIRDVSVLPHPGFLAGELLPASTEALLCAYASAVQKCADGAPFVLVGYSVGGLVAHAVAAHLETVGITPAAVVLIDTYSAEDVETWWEAKRGLEQTMMDRNDDTGDASRGDSWVTAMARYFTFDWWDMVETAAPTLLVRATDPVSEVPEGVEWNVSFRFARTVTMLAAPGNHFTLIRESAASTAQMINDWLTASST